MSVCPSNDFQNVQPEAIILHIHRIEVFVIPALAVDANGFRVCLRISSNRGHGWSEIFIDDADPSFDLQGWEQQLSPFTGPSTMSSLTEQVAKLMQNAMNSDERCIYLFTNALHQLKFLPDTNATHYEEAILRQRAIQYLAV